MNETITATDIKEREKEGWQRFMERHGYDIQPNAYQADVLKCFMDAVLKELSIKP